MKKRTIPFSHKMLGLKRGLEISLLEFVNLKLRNEYLVCSPPDFPESDSDKSFPEIQINVIYDPCGNIFFKKGNQLVFSTSFLVNQCLLSQFATFFAQASKLL